MAPIRKGTIGNRNSARRGSLGNSPQQLKPHYDHLCDRTSAQRLAISGVPEVIRPQSTVPRSQRDLRHVAEFACRQPSWAIEPLILGRRPFEVIDGAARHLHGAHVPRDVHKHLPGALIRPVANVSAQLLQVRRRDLVGAGRNRAHRIHLGPQRGEHLTGVRLGRGLPRGIGRGLRRRLGLVRVSVPRGRLDRRVRILVSCAPCPCGVRRCGRRRRRWRRRSPPRPAPPSGPRRSCAALRRGCRTRPAASPIRSSYARSPFREHTRPRHAIRTCVAAVRGGEARGHRLPPARGYEARTSAARSPAIASAGVASSR